MCLFILPCICIYWQTLLDENPTQCNLPKTLLFWKLILLLLLFVFVCPLVINELPFFSISFNSLWHTLKKKKKKKFRGSHTVILFCCVPQISHISFHFKRPKRCNSLTDFEWKENRKRFGFQKNHNL